ncbi:MAG: amidohydrolase family protein [Saprospiraceae bacterium]|nr:amidohydrolase family protein [Saprospiraceae bacterium]
MKNILISLFFILGITALTAQTPVPAKSQDRPILIKGGTAHIGDGTIVENSLIAFAEGKITLVAAAGSSPEPPNHDIIDASGKHVYPGFILTNSQIGLTEVSSIRAMSDFQERGQINPNIRSVIAYNTDSEMVPAMRFNGILIAESVPLGGLISGTSSVMEMDGWNWEDACHTMDIGIHLRWPSRTTRDFDSATFTINEKPNKDYNKLYESLNKHFKDVLAYSKAESREVNLKMEAMQKLFSGDQILFIHAGGAKEIIESVRFAQHHGVKKIIIIAGTDASYVADFLAEQDIPVILPPTHSLPTRPDQDIDLPYRLPQILSEKGVQVSLSHTGAQGNARNLPFYAGTAVAYGMDREEALKTITLHPAKVLGVDHRLGSLTVGKDATLFISKGDALDIRGNVLQHAFIQGKKINLFGKQQELFERYSAKYGH